MLAELFYLSEVPFDIGWLDAVPPELAR